MCAVIGAYIKNANDEDLETIKKIILESKIRGLHATGVSYVKNQKVYTIKEPVSSNFFVQKHDFKQYINEDGNLYLTAHCRYSTSDLNYNQPIQINSKLSIVHNGVISQDAPENWLYKAKGKNDSELINLCILDKKNPIDLYKNASMSVIELHSDRTIKYYRNGKRPLYKTQVEKGFYITSTADIMKRTNKNYLPTKVNNSSFQNDMQY